VIALLAEAERPEEALVPEGGANYRASAQEVLDKRIQNVVTGDGGYVDREGEFGEPCFRKLLRLDQRPDEPDDAIANATQSGDLGGLRGSERRVVRHNQQ
jgi:hypothetical protein